MENHALNKTLIKWLEELGEFIQTNRSYSVNEKADFRDLVSDVDIAVEKKLTAYIQSLPGDHTILGEESNKEVDLKAEHLWVIDPIDGTSNFIKQADDYGILVAYFKKGEPQLSYIYEVESHTLVSAVKGQGVFINETKIDTPDDLALDEALVSINPRKMNGTRLMSFLVDKSFDIRFLGSSVSDSLRVFSGKYGAFVSPESEPWDRAPYILIANELGIQMSQFNGQPTTLEGDQNFYLGSKTIFKELFDQMKDFKWE